ncbi:MAG: serine/threonine protein kinase, partial [Planctomycetes bacterium]|nr:serine/threonine protein kinase [Planctomycetota bacterium]
MRALFERALSLPVGERDAFVRAQAAGDAGLADEVLALLGRGDARTSGLAGAARRDFAATAQDGTTPPPRDAADHVQSTATGELMEKLAKAPKLDEQRFTLEGEVGKGGMGAVLRIHDRFLNRRLAMKVLLERAAPRDDDERKLSHQLLGRFLEEAQVTSQLDHPGVVPVHELGLDANGKVWFTMRLVKGRTASEVFADAHADRNDWTTTRALEVILKVCDTMAYAHDKGVLHRDLKPANVMVGRFGEVYVMDWGLAKVLGQADRHDLRIRKDDSTGISRLATARQRDADTDAASSVVSMDGQQLGTPSYMPPEQARSEELDGRGDVYAIGAMLYELLTGLPPYVAPGARKPAYRILDDVLFGPPKRIEEVQKGVPAELVAIVERAMAREREQRYANTLELAADVRAFLAQRTVKAYRTGALVEMKLWMRRNRALASALAAAVLILVAGIFFVSVYAQRADAQARENAQLANKEAAARQQFEGKVKEFDQLSLVVAYEQLLAEEATLVPGWPHQVAAIDAWVQRARQLLAQRDEIAATVAAMQQRAAT